MSKQYNKTENRSRRKRYLKRKKTALKAKAAVKKTTSAAPAA
ncbi:MAG: hypothetical protein ABSC03_14765 [Verrucomicrobiota bacterium]|jgi:hypothetical protein